MTIKQNGGVFGRNPTFNDVTIDGDLTVEGTVIHTGDLTVDNINISGNAISSTNTNGNIDLNADGTGFVEINKPATAGIVTGIKMINPQNAAGTGDGTNIIFQNTGDSGRRSEIQGYSNNNYGLDNGLRFLTQDGSSTPRTVLDLRGGAAGDVKVSIGNLVISTSGKGIDFSATAGTGTSELLDDYEEGVFSPTVIGSVSAGTGTYTQNVGFYTKVGDRVMFTIAINMTGHTGSGNMRIAGLPFTSSGVTGDLSYFEAAASSLTYSGELKAYVSGGSTEAQFLSMASGASLAAVVLDPSSELRLTGVYRSA